MKRSPGGVRLVKCRRLRRAGYFGGMAEMRLYFAGVNDPGNTETEMGDDANVQK